jgi:hypothetical protein
MSSQMTKGKCVYCGALFAKSGMTRHLQACQARREALAQPLKGRRVRETQILQLRVEGRRLPEYWMNIEIPADATLAHLDQFLRDIWVECCGHLSAFTIEGVSYSSDPERDYDERSMRAKIGNVFAPGIVALYEYDFGSTTEILLRVVGEREGQYAGYKPQVLARNEPPEILCSKCSEPATWICTACAWEDSESWFCDRHAVEHACGAEAMLPVVNSPRVGVCAYAG